MRRVTYRWLTESTWQAEPRVCAELPIGGRSDAAPFSQIWVPWAGQHRLGQDAWWRCASCAVFRVPWGRNKGVWTATPSEA